MSALFGYYKGQILDQMSISISVTVENGPQLNNPLQTEICVNLLNNSQKKNHSRIKKVIICWKYRRAKINIWKFSCSTRLSQSLIDANQTNSVEY